MKDLIHRIYNSDLDEVTRYIYSYSLNRKYEKRDELFNKLSERLKDEDILLLNEYANAALDITNEEKYMGFRIGMQLSARLMTELLADD